MEEKYNANNESLFKLGFALCISPLFLAILFSVNFEYSFHDRFSSNRMPRNFKDNCLFVGLLLRKSFCNTSEKSFLLQALWTIELFLLLVFKESLFEINHSLTFCNSLFNVKKRMLMSLCSKHKFVCKHYSI